ncbi:hypothetical protein H8356DRAFT_1329716 [Neocallimastix lanati (nom. inval.)]|nr:hypothetical protein H8356DRAFT_1329716 [Neocallimastix sp. JGI-2020a]
MKQTKNSNKESSSNNNKNGDNEDMFKIMLNDMTQMINDKLRNNLENLDYWLMSVKLKPKAFIKTYYNKTHRNEDNIKTINTNDINDEALYTHQNIKNNLLSMYSILDNRCQIVIAYKSAGEKSCCGQRLNQILNYCTTTLLSSFKLSIKFWNSLPTLLSMQGMFAFIEDMPCTINTIFFSLNKYINSINNFSDLLIEEEKF